jgi:hypothetical protein
VTGRAEPKVLLMQLSERTSAKGTRYFTGYLGKARLVGFLDQESDKFGNPVWNVYASEPAPRGDQAAGAGPEFLHKGLERAHARERSR